MSKYFKGFTAFMLFIAMIASSSVTIYANEPELTEVYGDDKIQVVLPTDAVGIFDFILDPQELIYQTDASAYEGQTFEEGATVFFKRSDGESLEDYNSTSDAVTISNTGSAPIDVVITAGIKAQANDEFAMTDDREFAEDTRPSLYLALTDGETEIPIMGEEEEAAKLEITIPPALEEEPGENEYSFRLTGAANKEGDWSRIKDTPFEVTVTWEIVPQEEDPAAEEESLEEEPASETEPVTVPGEEIIRKTVPVVTDSNVPDDVKSEIVPTDKGTEEIKSEIVPTDKGTEEIKSEIVPTDKGMEQVEALKEEPLESEKSVISQKENSQKVQ